MVYLIFFTGVTDGDFQYE